MRILNVYWRVLFENFCFWCRLWLLGQFQRLVCKLVLKGLVSSHSAESFDFLTTIINFSEQARKKSHASWITPIYSDFSKLWCWKILFICVTTSILDMLKLEKTVRFESTDSSPKIQVHSPLCAIKIYPDIDYSAPREIIRFRTMRRNQFLQN